MAWEDERRAELSDETWDRCLTAVRSCSVNSRHQLIQVKVTHRLHYTNTKLHNIFSSVSPFCDKCKVTEDATAHAFWYCPSLSGLWSSMFDWDSKAYNRAGRGTCHFRLFTTHFYPSKSFITGPQSGYDRGQKNWKSSSPPSFTLWTWFLSYKWKDSDFWDLTPLKSVLLSGDHFWDI